MGHSQMGLSAIFPNNQSNTISSRNTQPAAHISPGSEGYGFQHMLHQHISSEGAASGQHHSSFLESIKEDDNGPQDDEEAGHGVTSASSYRPSEGFFGRNSQSVLGASMGASMTGGLNRREGPLEGSHDGILQSVCMSSQTSGFDVRPSDVTSADMCLSTLYLHELHHRHLKRRNLTTADYRNRLQGQRTHQQQASTQPTTSNSSISYNPYTSMPTSAVEKTPLLCVNKS